MKLFAVFITTLFTGCFSASLDKRSLLSRAEKIQEYVHKIEKNEDGYLTYDDIFVLKTQSLLLEAIAVSLSSQMDSELILPGIDMTLTGIEKTVASKFESDFYGSHLEHSSHDPGAVTEPTTGPTVTVTDSVSEVLTQESKHSTDSSVDSNDIKEMITKAAKLKEKAKDSIQKLTDSHRISEALNLESNVMHMEELVDQLKIYLTEINSIKTDLISVENKIEKQMKN